MSETKMWDGRFDSGMAKSMEDLSFSLNTDVNFIAEDIQGTIGHCAGLVESKVLTQVEFDMVAQGLEEILTDFLTGKSLWEAGDEDVHMAVERVLTARIGDLGKKIHTGRSRNDQVQTGFKLYMRNRATEIFEQIRNLQKVVLQLAEDHYGKIIPGYTHVQQAQPVLFSHYIMSLFWVLERDAQRLQSFLDIHNTMPLGSGALAGSAFPYQRDLVAQKLGFKEPTHNSIDATTHRDTAMELLSHISICGATLSRYAEDFVNWSTWEFGFLTLHDAFSSGSSMMPQKKNPDSMELIRGKAGRLAGNWSTLFTVVKGAPLCYSRDLQEDKEPVFDSVKTIKVVLDVMTQALESATWNFETMAQKMMPALLATDLADLLVENGTPFRDAHHIVGSLVGLASQKGTEFIDLPPEDWAHIENGEEIRGKLTFENAVNRRGLYGGTGFDAVKEQMEIAKTKLD